MYRRIGPYTVLRRLGAGGMGEVFLGRTPAGRAVAVKVVKRAFAEDAQFRDRFRREVAAARSVDGAFTAPVVDADPDAAEPWLATEFLPGPSLRKAVAAHGPLSAGAVLALAAGLAEAARVTRTGQVIGTPGFMPPEQAAGLETGPAGDVFALGATLMYAVTGTSPFGKAGPEAQIYRNAWEEPRFDQVEDARLRDLVADCMKRDPAARPAPDQLLRRLSAPPDGTGWLPETVAADIAGRAEDTRVLLRRRWRGPVIVLAVVGLVVLAVAGTLVLHSLKVGGSGCDSRCQREYDSELAFAKEWDGRLGSLSNCSTEADGCLGIVGMAHDLQMAIESRPDSDRYQKALEEASRLEQAGIAYGACIPDGMSTGSPLFCARAVGDVESAGTEVMGELHAVPTRTFTGS